MSDLPVVTSADLKRSVLFNVVQAHARFLRVVTGDATSEERDTWKVKEIAARAYLAGDADAPQRALIENEASGGTRAPADLAAVIIVKADAFKDLVGVAGKVRATAHAAIAKIGDDMDIAVASVAATAALASMEAGFAAAEAAWHERTGQ